MRLKNLYMCKLEKIIAQRYISLTSPSISITNIVMATSKWVCKLQNRRVVTKSINKNFMKWGYCVMWFLLKIAKRYYLMAKISNPLSGRNLEPYLIIQCVLMFGSVLCTSKYGMQHDDGSRIVATGKSTLVPVAVACE